MCSCQHPALLDNNKHNEHRNKLTERKETGTDKSTPLPCGTEDDREEAD